MMKKILLALFFVFSVFTAARAAERQVSEVTVVVGETLRYHPAGLLVTGVTAVEGDNFAEAEKEGFALLVKGKKEGIATFSISLKNREDLLLRVKVVHRSFAAKPSDTPEKLKWPGTYELNVPENHYCVVYSNYSESRKEVNQYTCARIGDIVVCLQNNIQDGYWIGDKFVYDEHLGYNGGFVDNHFIYTLGQGDDTIEAGKDYFDEYAPTPESNGLLSNAFELLYFGWDNKGNENYERGVVMQHLRQYNRQPSFLDRFYRGEEEVCGVKCWVFDMRGQSQYGMGDSCWWIDPQTGLALRRLDEDGSETLVTLFNLNYHEWDIIARPELF